MKPKLNFGKGCCMRAEFHLRMGLGLVLFALPATGFANAQAAQSAAAVKVSSGSAALPVRPQPATGGLVGETLVREIHDPNTGRKWLLFRDPSHPGPGRLLEADIHSMVTGGAVNSAIAAEGSRPNLPIIHTGDRVILEEDTPRVEARLEAFALGPAAEGGRLEVRLRIGGQVVNAMALAAGRVELATRPEAAR